MFSGIVEELGKVNKITKGNDSCHMVLESRLSEYLIEGSSIAVNGVCLTVTKRNINEFSLDVMPETVNKTNIGMLAVGDEVNLERPLAVDGRFEGHVVQGHVDDVGTIVDKKEVENAYEIRISSTKEILDLCVKKGSITVDGISLTLVEVNEKDFTVSIIPYTTKHTTLGFKDKGDVVNLEADILGKYITKYMQQRFETVNK